MTPRPLSVYVHLPWCVQRCPYCDFNAHALKGELPSAQYVAALLADLDHDLARLGNLGPVSTVFFGGGTPSLFPPAAIAEIIEGIDQRLGFVGDAELTLEANPGASDLARFRGFREAGVNRLSVGVQTFDDTRLRALGRIHDSAEARDAVETALRIFERVNLDLMYGLPAQDIAAAVDDVEQALALGISHLSHYQLTLEPGTVFANRPPELPPHDTCADMQLACERVLLDAGLERYEVSAWARPGQACRHNLNYWRYGDYLGLGAGAHGKVSLPEDGLILRSERARQPRRYLAGEAPVWREVPEADRRFEFLLNNLRLRVGFTETEFSAHTLLPSEPLRTELTKLVEAGWMEADDEGRWRASEQGWRFLDDLLARFLPEGV